jgi:hypothetical protein
MCRLCWGTYNVFDKNTVKQVTHERIRLDLGVPDIVDEVLSRQWGFVGRLSRMPEEVPGRMMLFGRLAGRTNPMQDAGSGRLPGKTLIRQYREVLATPELPCYDVEIWTQVAACASQWARTGRLTFNFLKPPTTGSPSAWCLFYAAHAATRMADIDKARRAEDGGGGNPAQPARVADAAVSLSTDWRAMNAQQQGKWHRKAAVVKAKAGERATERLREHMQRVQRLAKRYEPVRKLVQRQARANALDGWADWTRCPIASCGATGFGSKAFTVRHLRGVHPVVGTEFVCTCTGGVVATRASVIAAHAAVCLGISWQRQATRVTWVTDAATGLPASTERRDMTLAAQGAWPTGDGRHRTGQQLHAAATRRQRWAATGGAGPGGSPRVH